MELHHSTSSFEEGEACCYYNDDHDDSNFDPDVALSYIDERIQNVLGHFQKDFEGGVSAENLGAKFGGYGSFLPTYQRSPPRPHTKTPERKYIVPRSPVNVHVEGAAKNITAPSKTPSLGRPGIAACNAKSLYIKKLPSPDVAINRDSCLLSAQVAETPPYTNETLNLPVDPNRQRQPKLIIKMGSDNLVRNNAKIYSGLGLDDSPSSSGGYNPDISGAVPSKYCETSNESPTKILQAMTSFPVVGGLLLSPLHDDLLCLTTEEILSGESGSVLKGNQENSVKLTYKSDIKMTVSNAIKEKKKWFDAKVETPKKNANGTGAENVTTVLSSKNLRSVASEGKNSTSKKLKLTEPINLMCGSDISTIDTVRTDDILVEAKKDGLKCSSSSFDLVKEEPMGLYRECKTERVKANHTFKMKVADQQNGLQLDTQNESSCKSNKTSTPFSFDIPKDTEAVIVDVREPSKQQHGYVAPVHENKGMTLSSRVGKEFVGSKAKLNQVQIKGTQAVNVVEKSMSLRLNALSEDSTAKGVEKSKSKIIRLKKQKNDGKLAGHFNDFMGDIKLKQIENLKRPLDMTTKNSNHDYSEKEYDTFFDKSMEQSACGGEVGKKSMYEVSLKESPNGALTENGQAFEMALPLADPRVILDDWVACDSCEKWRLLPYGITPDQLPEDWMCSMLYWLPGMNRCEISEEATTEAVHALPINRSKSIDETTLNVSSVNGQLSHNYENQISQPITARENKSYKRKESTDANSSGRFVQISNSTKKHHRESGRSSSLNGPNQIIEPALRQNKTKHNRDDVKQANIKDTRKADQYELGGSKRVKTENFGYELNRNSQLDGAINCAEFSTMGTGRSMQNFAAVGSLKNSTSTSKDTQYVSVKKEKDVSLLPLGGESSYLKVSDKRDSSLKKRNINDLRGDRNPLEGTSLPKDIKPKIVGSEFRKDKNTCISMGEGNESSSNKSNHRENEKGRVPRIILSFNRGYRIDGSDKTISKKNSEVQRGKIVVTPPTLNGKCDSEYVTTETTSSSSKVSGLRRSKFKLQDVRGSPVESVSSSPLRTSYPEQVVPEKRENCEKIDAANEGLHVRGNRGIDKRNRDGSMRKEIDFRFVRNESNENSTLDYRERLVNRKLDSKNRPSIDIHSSQSVVGDADTTRHHIRSYIEHDKGLKDNDGFRSDCDRSKMKICSPTSEPKAKWVPRHEGNKKALTEGHSEVPVLEEGTVFNVVSADIPAGVDVTRSTKQLQCADHQKGAHYQLEHPMYNRQRVNELNESSPMRKDPSNQNSSNALKEAKDLKAFADSLKNSGFDDERRAAYFQAALKFLLAASLLETSNAERDGDISQIESYISAAKHCEMCALEYEGHQDIVTAALLYKCMEVAYMRTIYCKHSTTRRDRDELQATLQMPPLGESPSSSVSDVDNVNNQSTTCKAATLSKGCGSHATTGHVIASHNRPNVIRLLDFTQQVNLAMEASTKSQKAFTAATLVLSEKHNKEGIDYLKRVVDFSFHDVEGFVRLVQLAMEAISGSGHE